MTTELTPPTSAEPTLSAGQKLRQAREQQHLTTAQVAQQLNLSKSLIEDIEQDQVDAKLSSTFVRGYLRSYAKLLKIPAQQILEAYSSNAKGLHQVPSLTRSFSKRTATEATENRFMWVTYFVIAVFIVLLVVGFWQSRFGSSASGTALPMAQTDETMQASADAQSAQGANFAQAAQRPSQPQHEIPVTQLDHSPAATDSSAPAVTQPQSDVAADVPVVLPAQPQQSTVPATTTSTENVSAQTVQPTAAGQTPAVATDAAAQSQNPAVVTDAATQPQSQTVAGDSTSVPPVSAQSTNTASTPAAATAEPQNTAQADAAANATVSLSLSAECWLDVVDATGKRLVFGSRQAGEQLNLRGVAPIKVILGNAAAATLSFNGEAVDLSGYPTGRVARLTLGQN